MLLLAIITLCKVAHETYSLELLQFWGLTLMALTLLVLAFGYIENFGMDWKQWLLIAIGSLIYLTIKWPRPANHLYVYIYLSLVLAVSLFNREHSVQVLKNNTKYLFVLIMLMAVLQKAITPGYLDGTINAFWLLNGGYFKPIFQFSETWTGILNDNNELLNDYYNNTPTRVDTLQLKSPVEDLRVWGIVLSLLILVGELVAPLVFLWGRSQVIKHMTILLLIPSIFLARQETGFLSMFCIIGIVNCPPKHWKIRTIYCIFFGIMQLILLLDYAYM